MWAARDGRTEVVTLVLRVGANSDLQNEVLSVIRLHLIN